jgi:hypothetical protein
MPSTRSQKLEEKVKIKTELKPLAVKQENNIENIKKESDVKNEPMEDDNRVKKPKKEVDRNGESFWKLGRNRRLTISKYKGIEYVNIRMFFTDDESGA